ncbi:MAG: hypothetical protein U9Q20_09015 [Campylobacterota bacterium]|nr:hypothetical protein [Campylobacterota bacterium]
MDKQELNEARTNPEFLAYLNEKEKEVMESRSVSGLYEVLDSLLVLDLDEQRVHKIYSEILKVSFDKIEERLKEDTKLSLDGEDIYFVRSFYEHAIEKWSMLNFDGANELFFILTQIVDDEVLVDALNVHLIACAKKIDMDNFYDDNVLLEDKEIDEKYGYFITEFNFDTKKYLESNVNILNEQFEKLKHLLS